MRLDLLVIVHDSLQVEPIVHRGCHHLVDVSVLIEVGIIFLKHIVVVSLLALILE